jgi:hypothetical protein
MAEGGAPNSRRNARRQALDRQRRREVRAQVVVWPERLAAACIN